jgi:DedD protein
MSDPLNDDDQIELKKRARRRLIGALVFATAAAVVLPMVMDKEPPPAQPHIDLRIPAQDKGFVPPPARPAVPSVAEPVPAQTAAEPPKAVPAPPEAPKVAAVAKPEPPVAEAPAAKPEARPAPKAKPEAKPVAAAKGSEAQRAQAILNGQEVKPVAEAPHVVLIGAFANPGNVENLRKKLGELGIKVYTEPLDSPQGKKTRVRAGPFPSRDAAEKAAARMKAIGVGGVVAAKS